MAQLQMRQRQRLRELARGEQRAEYRSELLGLAHSGAGHRQQLMYATRQLRRAIPMGLAMRSPHRRKAAP